MPLEGKKQSCAFSVMVVLMQTLVEMLAEEFRLWTGDMKEYLWWG